MSDKSVSISKGGKVNISKLTDDGTLTKVHVGAGWDEIASGGQAFDMDLSATFVGSDGKCKDKSRFLYFGSGKNSEGKLCAGDFAYHTGDNLTGEGEGDDEVIKIDLNKVPEDVAEIQFQALIYQASSRGQNFGNVENCFIRMVDDSNDKELSRFDLDFDADNETGFTLCSLIRRNGQWFFKAIEEPITGEISGLLSSVGLQAG
jgi:tellurium resistance protein TerD